MPPDLSLPPNPVAQPGRYLTFTLGHESYGLPVLSVREMARA